MNSKRTRAFVLAAALTALIGSGAFAQVDQVDPPSAVEPGGAMMTPAQTNTPTQTTAPRNDGFDWGWIGLLGLIGLTGLGRREARPVDRDTAYPAKRTDTVATPLGGAR